MRSSMQIVCAAVLLAASAATAQTTLVVSGVSELAPGGFGTSSPPGLADPAIYFFTAPTCNVAGLPNETSPAKIARAPSYVWIPRDVFVFNPQRAAGVCNSFQLQSNLVADATHVFWFDNQSIFGSQLVKLPRSANPGDAPTLLKEFFAPPLGSQPNEIVQFANRILMIVHEPTQDILAELDKDALTGMATLVAGRPANSMSGLQFDGRWIWWLEGTTLRRYDTQGGGPQTIDTNVRSFLSLGDQSRCSPLGCQNQNSVYVAKGNQVLLIDSFALGTPPFVVYTAPSSRPGAFVKQLIRDNDELFFLEVFPSPLSLSVENFIFRYFTSPQLIHGPFTRLSSYRNLQTDNVNLIWHDPYPPAPATSGLVSTIKNNTPELFLLEATGLEVTQGIQNLSGDVRLIENKTTLVRFYVRSGDSRKVPGVTASLSGFTQTAGNLGTLEPLNPGKLVDVVRNPQRFQLARSFVFALPNDWTTRGPLNLVAQVNPSGKTPESDTSDNHAFAGPLPFTPSPTARILYWNVGYPLGGSIYVPSDEDIAGSIRHLGRLYPLSSPTDGIAGPGLHVTSSLLWAPDIAPHVTRTDAECIKRYPFDADKAKDLTKDRNKCASDFVHALIAEERKLGTIPAQTRTYANIAQAPAPPKLNYFTRGYGAGFKASGPSGPETNDTFRNYAAHEVGHMFGRDHPVTGTQCGHDPVAAYPYADARIGQADSALKEFAYAEPYVAFAYDLAFDVMGYCEPNRISDHSFEGLYQSLTTPPPAAASGFGPSAGAPLPGDWLFLTGVIDANGSRADIVRARRVAEVSDATPPDSLGANGLELLDAGGNLLASHAFGATPIGDDPGRSSWDLVVPFAPGTAELRIVDGASGTPLTALSVSPNAPVVSDVELPGAPDPVDGLVTLTWLASDADGDPLGFDLLASVDAGVSFRKVVSGMPASPYDLDSTLLAGGPTILRVRANDGLQTGVADSAPITVAPRAPKVAIMSPGDGHTADWAQLITFEGFASDLQDEFIPDSDFVWTNAYGVIGTGRNLQTSALQVGVNTVTLTVTNSLGASATDVIDVIVGDRLADPGPFLAATPQTLSWHVADSETAAQAGTLTVENAGGGNLSFDISSDQPWLTIDGASALNGVTAPATFAISADAVAVPPGQSRDAVISIQHVANPLDVLPIPVSLAKGNVFDQTGNLDSDADSVPDFVDNCPNFPNAGQEDEGGVGAAAPPDGIGDACQCGDVSGNGRVTTADATLITRSLLVPPTAALTRPDLCNAGGSAACTTADAVIVTRALLVPATAAVQQSCLAALP